MGDPGGPAGFTFIARPYVEVVSFTPIGAPVPNRGGAAGELFITGLIYDSRNTDLVANEPLHLETGMWLNLAAVQGGTPPDQPIVRSASIPHGDSVLALGTSSEIAGPPDIQLTSAVPDAGPEGPARLRGRLAGRDRVPVRCKRRRERERHAVRVRLLDRDDRGHGKERRAVPGSGPAAAVLAADEHRVPAAVRQLRPADHVAAREREHAAQAVTRGG